MFTSLVYKSQVTKFFTLATNNFEP